MDILFLHLDYAETLKKHPLRRQIEELVKSDRKKKTMGIVKPRKLLGKLEGQKDYHRLGPLILVTFQGPEKLREKFRRTVCLELKSSLGFDKKVVGKKEYDGKAFLMKTPLRKKKTNLEKQQEAKWEEEYTANEKAIAIASAGTKFTRNRARTRLQLETRLREAAEEEAKRAKKQQHREEQQLEQKRQKQQEREERQRRQEEVMAEAADYSKFWNEMSKKE